MPDVIRTYDEIAQHLNSDGVIRCGELMLKMLDAGLSPLWRDGWHTSKGLGRYAMGLLWYRTLLDADISGNTFRYFDEPISESDITKVKKIVSSIDI